MPGFQNTTAIHKLFQLHKRIRAVSGGTAACKTVGILIWLIDYAQSASNEVITVVAESVPHLKLGAIRDFKNIMQSQGYWRQASWNETDHIYTFPRGNILEFISFDKFGKAHGPRRDILFINEANNLPYHIVDQLITRTRKIVWMDWNPTEEFWFYTEMQGKRNDIDFITLNYLDNEAIDAVTKAEIESHKDNKVWWTVYGLGQLGEIETRIYKGWQFIDEVPHEARLERTGLDFGYSNDPSAIVDVYYHNGGYIFDEIAFQKGLFNNQIADIIKNKERQAPIVPDPYEPKSCDELRLYGLTILDAPKGENAKRQGIQWVQNQRCSVTKRSINIIKEYRNYCWLTDKNGKIINEDDHTWSHSMTAIMYAMQTLKPRENEVTRLQKDYFLRNQANMNLNSTK